MSIKDEIAALDNEVTLANRHDLTDIEPCDLKALADSHTRLLKLVLADIRAVDGHDFLDLDKTTEAEAQAIMQKLEAAREAEKL
jgi:hypothetical protein